MNKVYVSGALTNVPNPGELKDFYADIGKLCNDLGFETYVPHTNGTDPVEFPDVLPKCVFQIDYQHVSTSNLIIAYVGIPSLGVGIELGWSQTLGIPTILLLEEGKKISRLPLGLETIIEIIEFQNFSDALVKIKAHLETLQSRNFDLSLRKNSELHLKINSPPPPGKQQLTLINEYGSKIYEGESEHPNDDEVNLMKILHRLRLKGIYPEVIYVEPFSVDNNTIKMVWPTTKVLQEYW